MAIPSLSHSLNPSSKCTTGFNPILIASFAAKADLQALTQKKYGSYPG